MSETWRPIPRFPGYEVSDAGRIRSWRVPHQHPPATEPRVLALPPYKGYPGTVVCVDGRKVRLRAHVAVLEAFVGPRPTPRHQAAHGNGVRSDCRLTNLRWATPKENAADKIAHGTQPLGEEGRFAVLNEADVRRAFELRAAGSTQADIGRALGVSERAIRFILRGHRWSKALRRMGVSPLGPMAPVTRKLSDTRAAEIRALRNEGVGMEEIARRFGVHRTTVSRVCSGSLWAHMPVDAQLRLVGGGR